MPINKTTWGAGLGFGGYRFSQNFLIYSGVFGAYRDYDVQQFNTITNSDGSSRRVLRDQQKGNIFNQGINLP